MLLLTYISTKTLSTTQKRNLKYPKRSKSTQTNSIVLRCIAEYWNCSKRVALEYRSVLSKDDILNMANTLEWTKTEVNKLKKSL